MSRASRRECVFCFTSQDSSHRRGKRMATSFTRTRAPEARRSVSTVEPTSVSGCLELCQACRACVSTPFAPTGEGPESQKARSGLVETKRERRWWCWSLSHPVTSQRRPRGKGAVGLDGWHCTAAPSPCFCFCFCPRPALGLALHLHVSQLRAGVRTPKGSPSQPDDEPREEK